MIKAAVEEDGVRPFGFAELGSHCVCGWRAVTRESGRETRHLVQIKDKHKHSLPPIPINLPLR